MTPSDGRTPISTEARGRVRAWKRTALARYRRIEEVLVSDAFKKAGPDFTHKRGKGRQRALPKLKRMLAEAHFEHAKLEDPAFVLWSYLHPRESVVYPGENVRPAELQDCITVDYIALGSTWDHRIDRLNTGKGSGLWSLEVRDHALHRVVQRDPTADLDTVIFEAHHASLTVRLSGSGEHSFLIPAGRGAFICSLTAGPDSSTGLSCVCVSAHTWIHTDQMVEDQCFVARSDIPGERLGDNLLLPLALRHLVRAGA